MGSCKQPDSSPVYSTNVVKGFNNGEFSRSRRLQAEVQPPPFQLARYKIEGNYLEFQQFHSPDAQEGRRLDAWSQLIGSLTSTILLISCLISDV